MPPVDRWRQSVENTRKCRENVFVRLFGMKTSLDARIVGVGIHSVQGKRVHVEQWRSGGAIRERADLPLQYLTNALVYHFLNFLHGSRLRNRYSLGRVAGVADHHRLLVECSLPPSDEIGAEFLRQIYVQFQQE